MSKERIMPDLDERIARLGREWFAEARLRDAEEHRIAKRATRSGGTAGDAGDGFFSWLFSSGEAACAEADAGGDGGD